MCAYVSLQKPWAAERLAAGVAATALGVGAQVLAEGSRTQVRFTAVRTPTAAAGPTALVALPAGRIHR